MQKIERKSIWFNSADGKNKIAGFFYTCPEVEPFCVLQISHGMCEYIDRYQDFAYFLARNGVVVCGNDHLGHGASASTEDDLGYFTEKGGRKFALQDLHTMNQKAHEAYPHLPVVLLGHSMGSFFARRYAALWPKTISGLVISGTGGPNPLAAAGIAMAGLVAKIKGPRHRSSLVHNMAFGAYLKKIENPKTPYDWISRDEEIVALYANDAKCVFQFTVNGFHELFSALKDVSSPGWAAGINKQMPVYMFAGDADPVGDYGKGVVTVYNWLRDAGVKNVQLKLYPGGRHEMLNETNRAEVYDDVLEFLKANFGTNAV
ncbi:alpha/beta hydrolase [Ruminococcaceae bacterium OttesenSCG-928-A16]|nr:alpha/beta hydrolase [Ruminococcaceae bacterium OttesenSCG-928-A16]